MASLKKSLALLVLVVPLACSLEKADTADDSAATDLDTTSTTTTADESSGGTTQPTGEMGITPTSESGDESGDIGACPDVDPGADWGIAFAWNDDGPPGFEGGGEVEVELRKVPCTVTAVTPGPQLTLGLACTYAPETEPRAHEISFTLPAAAGDLVIAVDDGIELDYQRVSAFESPSRFHLELHRDDVTLLAATDQGDARFPQCDEPELLADFAEFGLALVHGACEPLTSDRLEFTIAGATAGLSSGTQGPLPGGHFGVVEEAFHAEVDGNPSCSYKVLVLQNGG